MVPWSTSISWNHLEICGESKELGNSEGFESFILSIGFIRLQRCSQTDVTRQLDRGKREIFFKSPFVKCTFWTDFLFHSVIACASSSLEPLQKCLRRSCRFQTSFEDSYYKNDPINCESKPARDAKPWKWSLQVRTASGAAVMVLNLVTETFVKIFVWDSTNQTNERKNHIPSAQSKKGRWRPVSQSIKQRKSLW